MPAIYPDFAFENGDFHKQNLVFPIRATQFANGMFKKAAQFEGVEVSDAGNPNPDLSRYQVTVDVARGASVQVENHPGFPQNMQPGRFAPMQPDEGKKDRADYIADYCYWGQPKIDGNKLIVFATRDGVFYQSRQMKLNPMPNAGLDDALRKVATFGNFILEGELTFLDSDHKEHRTASQAVTASAEKGVLQFLPKMRYVVFSAPYWAGHTANTYGEMVENGARLAKWCKDAGSTIITPIYTAKTPEEKTWMAANQKAQGREGECWFHHKMPYLPGKFKDDRFARTKYITEFVALCVGFTDTTAEGHAFGAMIIESLDGKPLGSVGTGFTREDKWMLKEYAANGPFKVEICSQGFTEGPEPKAWHARYRRIAE